MRLVCAEVNFCTEIHHNQERRDNQQLRYSSKAVEERVIHEISLCRSSTSAQKYITARGDSGPLVSRSHET